MDKDESSKEGPFGVTDFEDGAGTGAAGGVVEEWAEDALEGTGGVVEEMVEFPGGGAMDTA